MIHSDSDCDSDDGIQLTSSTRKLSNTSKATRKFVILHTLCTLCAGCSIIYYVLYTLKYAYYSQKYGDVNYSTHSRRI